MPEIQVEIDNNQEGQISEMIGNPPGWLLRSGISAVAIVVVLLLAFAAIIRYPDKILAQGVITTENPPVALVSKVEGRIENVFVQDKADVKKDDPIIYISNNANLAEVHVLEQQIAKVKSIRTASRSNSVDLPELDELGMMQDPYLELRLKVQELKVVLTQGSLQAFQAKTRNQEVSQIKNLNASLSKEKKLFREELVLKQKDHQRQLGLKKGEAISELDYEKSKSTLLQHQRQYEGMQSNIITNQIKIKQLHLQGSKESKVYKDALDVAYMGVQQAILGLESKLKEWRKKFFVQAEVSGKVAFAKNIREEGNVKVAGLIANIIQKKEGKTLALASVPVAASGKLEQGQKMILKIGAYPFKEFGVLTAQVSDIGLIAEANKEGKAFYEVRGNLPNVLITTYGKSIPKTPNMSVSVEIISKDKSLFQRIFNQFFNILNNK